MRESHFPFRLLPSRAEPLTRISAEERISVKTDINPAVRQTAAQFFAERARGGSPKRALEILEMARPDREPEPETSDASLEI